MYDVVVVGARCAGSPTAMLLARNGFRVLVVDRASFPSDTLSTHYIHQPGVARLERWGLLDAIRSSNCPPTYAQTLDLGAFALVGTPPAAEGVTAGYAPRRTVLDRILVDAAAAAGAEVRERFVVEELLYDDGRVSGIRGRSAGGATVTERATIVVGADGRNSFVARAVGAPAYQRRSPLTCAYYSYWEGVPAPGPELYPRPERMIIVGPTNDARTLVFVFWPHADFHRVRADLESNFLGALELAPALADRVRAGERAERFSGTSELPFYFRRPYGPGWALVGDAGYHKDPITAQGITDAFSDAELLAEAIDGGLGEGRDLEEGFAAYERARNERARPLYDLTAQLAALDRPSREMEELFEALRDDQEQTDRFFGTIAGTVPVHEFYAPENVASIMGAAAA